MLIERIADVSCEEPDQAGYLKSVVVSFQARAFKGEEVLRDLLVPNFKETFLRTFP